ncbi:MAG TPA: pyruvate kinase [Spirochaetota bacterium]|nr:pyruvate kinase [Spirochaetota bacterium]HOL58138.1 pyruvate kinase [Spirochaetota bacterium]HPP05674.1 pyruvate kinase [Spirochaetota bacterium]
MILRKTKIVCTIGPASSDVNIIKQLLMAGMNVARLNFSHGDHEYHKANIEKIRLASKETGIPVAILLDTKGPEIRTGNIKNGKTIKLVEGKKITLTTDEVEGTEEILSISYKKLPEEISVGKHIYIADGLIDLVVDDVKKNKIFCTIVNGGEISSKKNVNVVGVKTSLPAITEKDEKDIIFGIGQKVDFIAASFIRKPTDIIEIRNILNSYNLKIDIIAKIEDEEGLENIDEIIRVSNGIMIARGDLGVQIKTEEIPLVQKRIILKCNKMNRPVITATQMLDSMINNPKPTRAETTDVANAIFDGTDAIMLSGETASGKYPVEAVKTMHNIALKVEQSPEYLEKCKNYFYFYNSQNNVGESIAKAAFVVASDIKANAIITPTIHGNTPKLISKYRPMQNIIAATTSEETQKKLLLYWGIYSVITDLVSDSDIMLNNALQAALDNKYVNNFEKVVFVAGVPINSPAMLNLIKVHQIANILGTGKLGFGGRCSGKIVKAEDISEAILNIKGDGTEILLTRYIDDNFKPLIKNLKGIILEGYSAINWDDIKLINPEIVLISGVTKAFDHFENNLIVSLDGEAKVIYEGVIRLEE